MNRNLLATIIISFALLINSVSCSDNDVKTENSEKMASNLSASGAKNNQQNFVEAPKSNVFNVASVKKTSEGQVPDFTWIENGQEMSFYKLTKGKVVFLNFWGTWCPPCRAELPDIVSIDKDLANQDFIIIGINVNERAANPIDHISAFAQNQGINYRNIVDGKRELTMAFGGIPAVPTTVIIDKNKNVSETLVGAKSKQVFMNSINRAMKN